MDDIIILTPGRYEVAGYWNGGGLRVTTRVHIVGCGYNCKRGASPAWHDPSDVPKYVEASVVICSSIGSVIEWHADGGSISNCDVRFINTSRDSYYYSVYLPLNASVTIRNCAISSDQV